MRRCKVSPDGTSFVVNENAQSGQPKQAYYICAEVATWDQQMV